MNTSTAVPDGGGGPDRMPVELAAPAKVTLSLRVTGRRPDGYHLLESEMVTVDLADSLVVGEGDGLWVVEEFAAFAGTGASASGPDGAHRSPWRSGSVTTGADNLVARALDAVGRKARVELVKRIPPGAGLGGGSADAAAVLRWAGATDPGSAAQLGADIPFCLAGGRALVRGIGEQVEPLPFEERALTLFLLPFGMDTRAVYRAWDRREEEGRSSRSGGSVDPDGNDLEGPALEVEPRLGTWRDRVADVTGQRPRLAGSGSTWFVEGTPEELGVADRSVLHDRGQTALVVGVRTLPAR
ncbi:MAG TPA: 4-(cytidine 5'-diphospho)-2-C-methyl-D-erythritol kinase [Acidimicrobiales bacterium]|nr:4-(cytidine 5'-diphospho)-2-C-methyl-D-erythritol kinase [Acidimicrobiales bacterium]